MMAAPQGQHAGGYGRPPPQGYMQGYPPMAAPPMRRMPPPPPPPQMYYDNYDYGYPQGGGYDYYGGGYAYAPPAPMAPPMPRMSRYDAYMEEDPELASMGMGAGPMAPRQSMRPRTPPQVPTPIKGRGELPPTSMAEFDQREAAAQKSGKVMLPAHNRDLAIREPHSKSHLVDELPESEGERHLAKMSARYPSFSEPQMLQDHVDKMRIRLKSLAYSLDPTGPVPEIVIPDRTGANKISSVQSAEDSKKKYSMALEYKEMPNLSTRRAIRTYPEDEYMKDNLRIKCLSHYKTTRTAADYWRPKLSNVSITDGTTTDAALPESYSSKYQNKYQTKWEEPDTIYGSSSDKKPFSKVETGSSFFSTYGYTNRKKDTIAEKVRDYYYGIDDKEPMAEICPAPEPAQPAIERKKSKKKSSAKEEPMEPVHIPAPANEEAVSMSESAAAEEPFDPEADEKEKKKLEKKKRKAEREAAAKAAMEAELAALAAAEAELARLEQESVSLATPAGAPEESAAPVQIEIPTVEVQSEFAADKCESSSFNGGVIGVSVSGGDPPQQVTVQVVPEPMVTEAIPQVVEPPTPVLNAPAPPPEDEQHQVADSTAAAETSQ